VERAACRDVQTLGTCVRGDDEISTRCECVPVTFGVSRSFLVVMVGGASSTYQQMRCFSYFQCAPLLPKNRRLALSMSSFRELGTFH
jgi:hypothetical protein